jgi:hypothetical protein
MGKLFHEKLDYILKYFSVRRNGITLHRTAAEFNRLKQIFPPITTLLEKFIYDNIKDEMNTKKNYPFSLFKIKESLDNIILPGKYSYNREYLLTQYNKIIKNSDNLISRVFLDTKLGTFDMDIYTISRIFIQLNINKSQQIIIYAGNFHINLYIGFLHNYLGFPLIYKNKMKRNKRCIITSETLPFNPYKYRDNLLNNYI